MTTERGLRRPPERANTARHPRRTGRTTWLGVAAYGALGLGCFLLGALAFLIVAPPVDSLRDRIVQEVNRRTGRELTVAGPASMSFFPRPAVTLGDVTLSGPPGMEDQAILTASGIGAEVRLVSLLTGNPEIQRIVLTRPVLALKVDAQGRRNWDLASFRPEPRRQAQAASPERPTIIARAEAQGRGTADRRYSAAAAALAKIPLASVRIVDGTVRYEDARTGTTREASAINLDLTLDDPAGALDARGNISWRGEQLAIASTLSPADAAFEGQPGRLTIKLSGRPVEVSFDGRLATTGGLTLEGNVNLKTPSGAALEGWLGKRAFGAAGEEELRLSSAVALANGQLTLSDLSAMAGTNSLSGSLKVDIAPARPFVRGNIHVSEVDFSRLLMRQDAPPDNQRAAPSVPAAPKPQVRGFTKRAGETSDWSDEIIDLQTLGVVDADLKLTADRLIHREMKTGPARIALVLKNKVAVLNLEDVSLYQGRGQGVVTLDGTAETATLTSNLRLENVATEPLLGDALGFSWLAGRGSIGLALTGRGVSERQIVQTLNGKIEVTATDGSVRGADVSKILRNIEQGRFLDVSLSPEEKTSFAEFAGTFTISNGIASNQDLRLTSANLKVTGAGTIDLPARTLDYTVRPKVVGSAGGERAVVKLEDLEIPLRIAGSWEKPELELMGKDQIGEALKQIGKSLKSEDVQDAIKGLLGNGEGKRVKPRELLEKLLGK